MPCLATGTPQAAAISAASVEILRVPCPSPPVPTMSIAPGGAATRSIRARKAATAPVISATVSPRARSAIRSPPSWAGVTTSRENNIERGPSFDLGQARPGRDLGDQRLERIHFRPLNNLKPAKWRTLKSASAAHSRSIVPQGRENSQKCASHVRRRCFPDEIARHAREAACAKAP